MNRELPRQQSPIRESYYYARKKRSMDKTDTTIIIGLGALILLAGIAMPSTFEKQERFCGADDICQYDEEIVTYHEQNDFKAPTLVVGLALSGVGVFLYRET